jgi:hypothetical protein
MCWIKPVGTIVPVGRPAGSVSQWAESGIRGERRGFVPCQPQEIALASVTKRTMRRSKEERRQQMREQLQRGVERYTTF